ncbi:helix-turn-helix domain-containing protein [Streptomyces sp. NPDC056387]|uniref:helix-turn-helix domain-containing protein n=1 Tax=Streptomyces sp. NPDC056387 TaxID=3345803 RepID=UPI0035DA95B0
MPSSFGGRDAPQLSTRVRRKVLDLVASGRKVAEVAQLLGISEQTIYVWHHQQLIDSGQLPGHEQHRPVRTRCGPQTHGRAGGRVGHPPPCRRAAELPSCRAAELPSCRAAE